MKRGLLFFLLILIDFGFANAQLRQPARWEEENSYTDEPYNVVSLKENGLALIRDLDKFSNGMRKWELVILNIDLQESWRTEIELDSELRFTGFEHVNGRLNLMFRRSATDILRAEMLWIDLSSKEITRSNIDVKLQIQLTHYTVVDNNCVFGGYVSREPVLLIHDPDKQNNIIVPGFFLTDTELMDVRPNANSTFNILLFQRTVTDKKIIFRTIDKAGNILVEDEIQVDEDKNILSAATSVLEHDEVLIGGAYGYKNEKYANGIFSCMIDPFSEQSVQYVEFPALRHFLDYLPEKKKQKFKEKASERKSYNKPASYHANVNVHRIEEFENGFALFGESFVPTTTSSTNMYTASYYNPYSTYGYTPFASRYYNNPYLYPTKPAVEEMRMSEGFVIGFDFKGRRKWDYSVPMKDLKVPGRDQVGDFAVVNDVPHFIFKDENDLKYSYHEMDTSSIGGPDFVPIKLKYETDQVRPKEDDLGNVRHWYGNFFYVWGLQSIHQSERRGLDSSRKVFFINKIKIE